LANKKQEAPKESKRFDSTIKALFGEQAEEIIPCLLSDIRRPVGLSDDELNVELNRNTLSIDVGRYIVYKGYPVTFNLEAQSGPDDDLLPRMHEYALNLYRTYHRPVVSVALLLFEECGVPEVPFKMGCGEEVFSDFFPKIICMWKMDPQQVVEHHKRSLYTLLPTMEKPTASLLIKALQELSDHDTRPQLVRHLKWFHIMLHRTTTVSQEDKQKVEKYLNMQYQLHPLLAEDPLIQSVIAHEVAHGVEQGIAQKTAELEQRFPEELAKEVAKSLAEHEAKTIQESILDIVSDRFSSEIIAQVQQTIAPLQDIQQLRTFLRQIAPMSEEQEVYALLTQYLSLQGTRIEGEIKGIQESILDIVSDRFSSEIIAQVQQTIAPVQDVQQLRTFLRQLARTSDEEEIPALLTQSFPSN